MTTTETIVKMIFDRWNASIKNCDTLLNSLTDETLQKEIAPGKTEEFIYWDTLLRCTTIC